MRRTHLGQWQPWVLFTENELCWELFSVKPRIEQQSTPWPENDRPLETRESNNDNDEETERIGQLIQGGKIPKTTSSCQCCVLTTVKAYLLACTVTQAAQAGSETGREGRLGRSSVRIESEQLPQTAFALR